MTRTKPKLLERLLLTLAVSAAVFAIGSVSLRIPGAFVVLLSIGGRLDDGCTLRGAIAADRFERARTAARNDVAARSELVRTDGNLLLWRSPYGRAWVQNNNDAAFWAGDLHHWPPRWALQAEPLPVRPVNEGDVVIDAGGHIGESALAALRMGAALVISVEPDPLNAEAIRRNLAEPRNAGRLIVVERALFDKEGTLSLHRHDASTRATLESGATEGIQVPVTTLDRLVSELKLQRLDFIKMDIEGSEQGALRGGIQTLRRFKPALAVGAYHKPDDLTEIPKIVAASTSEYRMAPLRCLANAGRIFPHMLYFFVSDGS